MEQEYSKNMIYGNYRSMENQAFPIDCETLSALQNNTQKLAVIAKIAGCNLILSGCKISGTRRTEGYVYVDNGLTGEILYHPDQQKSDNCHIAEQNETVTADGTEYSDAYTTRYLAEGVGNAPIKWTLFTDISTISNYALKNVLTELQQSLQSEKTARENTVTAEKTARENADATLQKQINALKTNTSLVFVKGMIIMWSGAANQIPSGWALCNGQNGTPNLVNKFILGGTRAVDSGKITTNGLLTSNSKTLTVSNMPAHTHTASCISAGDHSHSFQYTAPSSRDTHKNGKYSDFSHFQSSYTATSSTQVDGSHSHTITIGSNGSGSAFTVQTQVPYYALCFIMKL